VQGRASPAPSETACGQDWDRRNGFHDLTHYHRRSDLADVLSTFIPLCDDDVYACVRCT